MWSRPALSPYPILLATVWFWSGLMSQGMSPRARKTQPEDFYVCSQKNRVSQLLVKGWEGKSVNCPWCSVQNWEPNQSWESNQEMHPSGVPVVAQRVKNPTSTHEDECSIPGPAQWVKESRVALNCSVGLRHGLDPELLWLWCRLAAPIWPLAYGNFHMLHVQPLKKKKDT